MLGVKAILVMVATILMPEALSMLLSFIDHLQSRSRGWHDNMLFQGCSSFMALVNVALPMS